MATIRQIVGKAVELKAAAEVLEALQNDKVNAQNAVSAVDVKIATQQPIVNALVAELRALINE